MGRFAAQRAACKLWSVVLACLVLIMIAGRPGAGVLLWALTPVGLLMLADAFYLSQSRHLATLVAKGTFTARDVLTREALPSSLMTDVRQLGTLVSLSVLPFYLALAGVVLTLGHLVLTPSPRPAALALGLGSSSQQASPLVSFGKPPVPVPIRNGRPSESPLPSTSSVTQASIQSAGIAAASRLSPPIGQPSSPFPPGYTRPGTPPNPAQNGLRPGQTKPLPPTNLAPGLASPTGTSQRHPGTESAPPSVIPGKSAPAGTGD